MFSRTSTLLLALSLSFAAYGQTTFGRISGTVVDPSEAGVPGAKVVILNTDTHAPRQVSTDAQGFFVAENLPIGPYDVTVEHTGFKRAEKRGLGLVADGRVTADFVLQVGDVSTTVEVVAQTVDALNTVSAEIAHVVDRGQVENLALNGRNYMELLSLVPGAVLSNPDMFSVNTTLSATNQAVNGHRTNSNNMTVDGLGNLDPGANGSLINNISPDFTQQVKIQTSNFSAQYGRSSGVAFNVVTRNGTDDLHGSLFEYFRNDRLDARNTFSPDKPALRFNDFGWSLGGPIRKSRLFFFLGEEWKRLRQSTAPLRVSLPTMAMLDGDFNGSGKTINQPGTKTPVPGNKLAPTSITDDGKAIANVYRAMIGMASTYSQTSVTNNAVFQTPNPLDYREDLARIDYRINDKHTFFGRWVDDYNSIYLAYGPGSVTSSYVPVVPEIRDRPGKSALLSETWVVSPTIVNEVHFGASWNSQHYWNQGDAWKRSTYGFTFQRVFPTIGAYPDGIPSINVQNFEQWKGPDQTLASPTTTIEANDNFSIVRGQHTLRVGFSVMRTRKDQNGRAAYDGNAVFNTSGNPNTTGYAFADALLGNFQNYSESAYDPFGKYRFTEPGAYVDESWRVSRKLSVNLGLRWEYMMAMYSTANNLSNFVPWLYDPSKAVKINSSGQIIPGSGNIYNGLQRVAGGINSDQAYLVPNAKDPAILAVPAGGPRGMYPSPQTWQPRFGFAYALNGRTTVRAGFGLFYDRIQGNPTMYTLNNPPYAGSAAYQYGNLSKIAGGATVSAPWADIQTMDPNLKTPYSEQFSFSIQRELPRRMFLEVAYVGTLGRHLLVEPDINQPTWSTLSGVASTVNIATIRPYLGYSKIQQFLSWGVSNYHGLQMKMERRVGRVQFTGSYTFSKNLADSSSDTENSLNFYNLKSVYGPAYSSNSGSSIDVRHAFVASFVWSLPTLAGHSAFLRQPFGGWQLNGILRAQSGFYYSIQGTSAILGARMADYLGGPALLPDPGPNGWFNAQAFAVAPQGRWGTSGGGNVEGPGLQQYNLSVSKTFRMTERFNFRLRSDFNNSLNNVNYQSPATNVSNTNFGTISGAYPARTIQLGAKLTF